MKPACQARPDLGQPPGRTPWQTLLRIWRNMAIAAPLMGATVGAAAGSPGWEAWLLMPLICLGGPLSLVAANSHVSLEVVVCVATYGLGVIWHLKRPSKWAKGVLVLLSVVWLLLGWTVASIPV